MGAVKTLLLSEGLNMVRINLNCTSCDYVKQEAMRTQVVPNFEQSLSGQPCPKCTAPALGITEVKDLIDDLAERAEQVDANVEILSTETEEGQMLKNSFGGIAATLRFKLTG